MEELDQCIRDNYRITTDETATEVRVMGRKFVRMA
jgi:hypothetical protein